MSRDKTPFNAEEKKIISDIGSRYRAYLKYKGYSFESYGELINLEETSCKDFVYFPNTLKTIPLHVMGADGISMDWLMGFADEMFRESPKDSSKFDWQVNFKNIVYNIDRDRSSKDRYLLALQLLPIIARWLEYQGEDQKQ